MSFRYLYRRRISYLALGAVALCVFIVLVVMTVMRGLVGDFKDKNHRFVGDCIVGTESLVGFPYYEQFADILQKADFVDSVSPVIKTYGLVGLADSENSNGVEIIGIEPILHSKVTGFGKTLLNHKNNPAKAFVPEIDNNQPGCVVGIDMWLNRDPNGQYQYSDSVPSTALAVTCFPLTVKGALAKAGTDLVNTAKFYFSDSSESGLARVDGSTIYLPFDRLQQLAGMNEPVKRASYIYIRFKSGVQLEDACGKVSRLWRQFVSQQTDSKYGELLDAVRVQDWKQYRREYIAGMEKEQTVMTAMFSLVGLTTIFIVFVVFYMIVSHKSKDIGVLKSIGASTTNLISLFLGFSFLIGLAGSAAGLACGWAFLNNINRLEGWLFEHFGFQLWDRTMYSIGEIPNDIQMQTVGVIAACAVAACLAGAILPTWRAAMAMPAETLQVSQL